MNNKIRILFYPANQLFRIGAFTLIELLVCIAIIGLLFSLIIPALGRARDQARLMTCKMHLRNICIGALMYADDNNYHLPVDDMLGPSFENSLTGDWVYNPHTSLIDTLSSKNYLQDPQNYYCPSQREPLYQFSKENFAAGEIGYFYFSVLENPVLNGSLSTFLRWPEMGKISYPRRLRSTMDSDMWLVSDFWFANRPTSHRWYKKGINYSTLDGSVRMVYNKPRIEFQ